MLATKPKSKKAAPSFKHEQKEVLVGGPKPHKKQFKKTMKQIKEKLDAPTIKKRKGSPPIR